MRYSDKRPEHYAPRHTHTTRTVVNVNGSLRAVTYRYHHCYRQDCEWYYDGSTARRAMLPRYTKTYLEQNNVKADPVPGYYIAQFSAELDRQIRDERRRGG